MNRFAAVLASMAVCLWCAADVASPVTDSVAPSGGIAVALWAVPVSMPGEESAGQKAALFYKAALKRAEEKKYDEAVELFTKVLAIDPSCAGAYVNRASVYRAAKQYAKAIDDCTRAIQLKGDSATAYNFRGLLHLDLGDVDAAWADCAVAVKLNGNYAADHNKLGVIAVRLGNISVAIDALTRAIELDGRSAAYYENRALAYYKARDYAAGILG